MKKDIRNLSGLDHRIFLFIALAYTALATFLSLGSPGDVPIADGQQLDKVAHFLAYFVFTAIWFFYFYRINNPRPLLFALVFAIVYGILMEMLQGMMNVGRTADLYDSLANTLGALTAVFLVNMLRKRVKNQ